MSDFFNLYSFDDYKKSFKGTNSAALTSCIQEIVKRLELNNLLYLELNETNLTTEHVTSLVQGLKNNTSLRILTLSYNPNLRDNDIINIVQAVTSHKNLLGLDLSNIDFTNAVAEQISDFIRRNKTLLYLNISHSKLNDQGIIPIAQALMENNSLLELELPGIYGFDNVMANQHLIAAVQQNQSLLFLSVGGRGISFEDIKAIKAKSISNLAGCKTAVKLPDNLFAYLQETRGFSWSIMQRDGRQVPLLDILNQVDTNYKSLLPAPRIKLH